MNFAIHIVISAIIFAILASGFKFFVKLRWSIDFSYIAIVIIASYTAALCNMHWGIWMLGTIFISFFVSIFFTILVLFLSSKLDDLYFTIWTLSLYILFYQLAYNLESITWWALWLSGISRNLIGNITIPWLNPFLLTSAIIALILFVWLMILKRSYFYKTLLGWWENERVSKSLWVKVTKYKFFMILLTSLFAVVWANLYTFYYLYIDPSSFWISFLILILIISFISYKWNDRWTLIVSIVIMFIYEYLRFFKLVDPSQIWYLRESLFGFIIIIIAFISFKNIKFGREN